MNVEEIEIELDLVSTAIRKVLQGGVSVDYQGRKVTRSELSELRAHRDALHSKLNRSTRSGMRVRQIVAD